MGPATSFVPDSDGPLAGLLPDFLLAAAFFTALTFALGQRFPRRTSAVASLATGLALATGLVWWEADRGVSIRNLGPLAVGFAILLLAAVMYRVLREVGGTVAGVSLTLGSSILIGWVLGLDIAIDALVLQTVTTVALLVGILALVNHRHDNHRWYPQAPATVPSVRNDLVRLYRDRQLGRWLRDNLRGVRREADFLDDHPELEQDSLLKLWRILPAEGHLTERLAELRERAHYLREGHVARIEEIRKDIAKLPPEAKRKFGEELAVRYRELKLDLRLERLDRACAEAERRIHELLLAAGEALQRHGHRRVAELFKAAEKLQAHNARLFKIIERTERKLIAVAQHVAQQTPEVTQP